MPKQYYQFHSRTADVDDLSFLSSFFVSSKEIQGFHRMKTPLGVGAGIWNGGRVQRGLEIQPMRQERLHGGGKQGRVAVNGSTDSSGMHSLSGVIDTSEDPARLTYSGYLRFGQTPSPWVLLNTS